MTFEHDGEVYDLYQVPIDGAIRELALVKRGELERRFSRPANPAGEPIVWQSPGEPSIRFGCLAPVWTNFSDVWTLIKFPRLIFNTIAIGVDRDDRHGGVLHLVAYGFARFRFRERACFSHC